MTQAERMQPIAVETDAGVAVPIGDASFSVALPMFDGPLGLLLHLIESRQLDVLTVPLADVADAYVEHLTEHPGRRRGAQRSSCRSPRSSSS